MINFVLLINVIKMEIVKAARNFLSLIMVFVVVPLFVTNVMNSIIVKIVNNKISSK